MKDKKMKALTLKNGVDKILTKEEFNEYSDDKIIVKNYISNSQDMMDEIEWLLSYLPYDEFYKSYSDVIKHFKENKGKKTTDKELY